MRASRSGGAYRRSAYLAKMGPAFDHEGVECDEVDQRERAHRVVDAVHTGRFGVVRG